LKRKNKRKPKEPKFRLGKVLNAYPSTWFWGILIVFGLLLTLRPIGDVDIWWHIAFGDTMLSHWKFPQSAEFYWSPVAYDVANDLRFTWLGDVIFSLFYRIGGAVSLQFLGLLLVGLSVWFLWDILGKKRTGQCLCLLLLFLAGTYQMHLVRNALYGLPATMALLWLWWRIHQGGPTKLWWGFPPLLGVWSCLHGTYLFGFGLLCLLVIGSVLEEIKKGSLPPLRSLGLKAGVLGVSYLAISIQNPLTKALTQSTWQWVASLPLWLFFIMAIFLVATLGFASRLPPEQRRRVLSPGIWITLGFGGILFLSRQFRPFFGDPESLKLLNLRAYQNTVNPELLGFFGRLKHGLNNSFWKSNAQQMASVDFLSPFDFAGDIFVWSSLLLLALATIGLLHQRQKDLAILLPFLAVTFLGFGYIRTIGFIAIYSAYILAIRPIDLFPQWRERIAWSTAALLALLALYASTNARNPLGWDADHRFQLGMASYFPQDLAQSIANLYPDEKVFTTIENGGFLLKSWHPDKKVFMDGFFRPHEGKTYLDYMRTLDTKDPEYLFREYGVTLAVVGVRDSRWFEVFNTSRNWMPRMADQGGILFERVPVPNAEFRFDLRITPQKWEQTEGYLKQLVAIRVYDIAFKLISKGLLLQAIQVFESPSSIVSDLKQLAPANIREPFEKSVEHLLRHYGRKNSTLIQAEFELSEAIQQGDSQNILRLGEMLVNPHAQPRRGDIWDLLIATAEKSDQKELANTYRKRRARFIAP